MDNLNRSIFLLFSLSMINHALGRCPTVYCGDSYCRSFEIPDRCLYVSQKIMNWFEAKNLCENLGMSMLQIKNEQVQSIVTQMNLRTPHWIGARGSPLQVWTWLHGGTYPVGTGFALEDYCGMLEWVERYSIIQDTFQIKPGHCAIPGHFICRKDNCHTFYADCLAVIYTPKTWFKAREFCLQHGSDLLYIRPGESINQLRNWMTDRVKDGLFFIGLKLKRWSWVDDATKDMYFTSWRQQQPAIHGATCLQVSPPGGLWNESSCYSVAAPICVHAKTTPVLPDIPRTTLLTSTTTSTTRRTTPTTISSTLSTIKTSRLTPTNALQIFTVSSTNSPVGTGSGHGHHHIGLIIAIVALAVVLITGAVVVSIYLLRSKSSSQSSQSVNPVSMSQLHSEPNHYEDITNLRNEAFEASACSADCNY